MPTYRQKIWGACDDPFHQLDRLVIVTAQIVRLSEIEQVIVGMEWIQANGFLNILPAFIGFTGPVQNVSKLNICLGVIGAKRYSPACGSDCLGMLTGGEIGPGQTCISQWQFIVQFHGALCCCQCRLNHFGIATHRHDET